MIACDYCITSDNQQIKVVQSVKLSALQLDDKLNFDLHIRDIYKSAANQLNALTILKKFFYGYFMANFNYCPIFHCLLFCTGC